MTKPIIGITMGEPAGIGPEISIKALCEAEIRNTCDLFIVGDKATLENAKSFSQGVKDINNYTITGYEKFSDIVFKEDEIPVLDFKNVDVENIQFGKDSIIGGKASGEYIKKAIELALEDKIQAVVTGPISKVSFKMGGWGLKYAGHTEMFADLTGTDRYAMLLAKSNFKVIHVTTHIPLKDVCQTISKEKIVDTIKLADQACKLFGIEKPSIGVCGINPHAGEGGKMGKEEIETIIPAIKECQAEGMNATGPWPPDTLWSKVLGGFYDIGVAMYHDQGHIPIKLLGFQYDTDGNYKDIDGINMTVGIPIIRVSVDHGVAYGKSGKGIATHKSLMEAIKTAVVLSKKK